MGSREQRDPGGPQATGSAPGPSEPGPHLLISIFYLTNTYLTVHVSTVQSTSQLLTHEIFITLSDMMSTVPILQIVKQSRRDNETCSRSPVSAQLQIKPNPLSAVPCTTAQGGHGTEPSSYILRSQLAMQPSRAGKRLTVQASWQQLPELGPGRVSREPVYVHLPF